MVSLEREQLDPSITQKGKFLELMKKYEPALCRLASVDMHTAADQDDLFAEIAIAIWTAIPRLPS
jgi:DNA-directed RNA polymerase specialized sigma24 family protein